MTRLELERELAKAKQNLLMVESKGASKEIISIFKNNVMYYHNRISIKNRNNNSATDFMVEFIDPYKKIDIGNSKEIYIASIRELGIENINREMKDFFFNQPKKEKESHYERLEPNIYLYVQLNNKAKINNLKKIADKTGRRISITPI